MLMTSLAVQADRCLTRRWAQFLTILKEEYDRAMLASSRYDALSGRGCGNTPNPCGQVRDIPRAIFDSFYGR